MAGTIAHVVAAFADPALRELLLLAGTLFLVGGLDDLAVDLTWLWVRAPALRLADLPASRRPGRIAILVPAWDEGDVIGAMLRATLARVAHHDYRIYVGCYPNDRDTLVAVAAVAEHDPRVRLVIGTMAGPTTKADCLNTLWRALLRADAADGRRTRAIVFHDAEDVVHPDELTLAERLLDDHALIQTPVMPLIDPARRMVSGHYADEFAYAHQVALPVRTAVGAALPLAGVGCAIRMDAMEALAAGGDPFEETSLTEDYELGLRLHQLGFRGIFARVTATDGALIATRAYFPDRIAAAVRQKARWMTGIALVGWDRIGWGRGWRPAEWWMRMRDRRAPLATVALMLGYAALVTGGASMVAHGWAGTTPPVWSPALRTLLALDAALLLWRLAARVCATGISYGRREAAWAIPRAVTGNIVALLAARRATARYLAVLAGVPLRWDKTRHRFPERLPDTVPAR